MLRCDCGFEARADDEEGLVAEVRRHARDVHGMALSADEALLLAFRAQLGVAAQTTTSWETAARPKEEER